MKTRRLIETLRTVAKDLVLDNAGVFHAEGGFRGTMADGYTMANNPSLPPELVDTFWSRLFCPDGRPEELICTPYCSDGFSFEAATHPRAITVEQEQILDGIGFSVLIGRSEQLQRLSRLIAAPITQYVRRYIGMDCGRLDSYYDTDTSLNEWVYMIYHLGLKFEIPALRRCYRLITPFTGENANPFLYGFSDTNPVYANPWADSAQWDLFWTAAENHEIAYSKLGTDLFMASQIALDYLVEYDFAALAQEFSDKPRHHFKRGQRATAIDRIKKELRQHLRAAKDYAIATRDRGHVKLLPISQKDIAKRLSLTTTNVSRCIHDSRDKEIQLLWAGTNNLDYVMNFRP